MKGDLSGFASMLSCEEFITKIKDFAFLTLPPRGWRGDERPPSLVISTINLATALYDGRREAKYSSCLWYVVLEKG